MSEVALYRKYRPKKFSDVIGQDHIVEVLQSAIKGKKVSHAYLFAGSRGTGKTSVARILAEEIGTSANDLYELDAASNRGIDEIRSIREAVNTLPFESPYKVYILDEAHMLTKDAWNALLKTLEEPPPHVIFILATTELEKVPETISSRCQTFLFKKPNLQILREEVARIAKKEGFTLERSSAELIALLGDGSFRDAESILQKVLTASSDKKITPEEVAKITGAPRSSVVNEFLSALEEKNIEKGFGAIRAASEGNVDMKVYVKLILHAVRQVLLLKHAPGLSKMIESETSEENFVFYKKLASNKTSPVTAGALSELLATYDQIGWAAIPELPLEIVLTKLASPKE